MPYCVNCEVIRGELTEIEQKWLEESRSFGGSVVLANTSIGFRAFHETYISRIRLVENSRIEVFPDIP